MNEYLNQVDWYNFLAECDCNSDGEEILDRREPKKYVNQLKRRTVK